MKTAKKFNCVNIEDEIQAKLTEEYDGLSNEEIRKRTQQKLRVSGSAVAKLWRSLPNATAR